MFTQVLRSGNTVRETSQLEESVQDVVEGVALLRAALIPAEDH